MQLDYVNFLNFQINNFSPEEVLPIFYPQVYDISDANISAEEFPAMEMPSRCTFKPTNIYLIFNSLQVILYVGCQAD